MSRKVPTYKVPPNQPTRVAKPFRADDYVTSTVSYEEILGIKEAFDIFDHDKSGFIDAHEVRDAFVSLGFANQNRFVARILNDYDTDHSNTIDFGEFVKLSTSRLGDTGSRAEIERVFNSFDINKNGKISAIDIKKVAEELGQSFSDQEIDKMVLKADTDEDGLLTLDDFYNVLTSMTAQEY